MCTCLCVTTLHTQTGLAGSKTPVHMKISTLQIRFPTEEGQ